MLGVTGVGKSVSQKRSALSEGDYLSDVVKRSGCYVEGVEKSVGIRKNVGIGGEVGGRSYRV